MLKQIIIILLIPVAVHAQDSCTSLFGESGFVSSFPFSHQQLVDSGYCETFTPPTNDFRRCYWFVPVMDSIYVNAAFSISNCSNVLLYDKIFYNKRCDSIGAGETIGGLNGDTIKWCVSGTTWGGPTCGSWGFIDICNYYVEMGYLLPIDLVQLYTRVEKEEVRLYWKTAIEINSAEYVIEYSNGGDFQFLGRLPANGTSYDLSSYSFTHNKPGPGIHYYRLKQLDFDGSYSYVGTTYATITENHVYEVYDLLGHLILRTKDERQISAVTTTGQVYIVMKDNEPIKYIGGTVAHF